MAQSEQTEAPWSDGSAAGRGALREGPQAGSVQARRKRRMAEFGVG